MLFDFGIIGWGPKVTNVDLNECNGWLLMRCDCGGFHAYHLVEVVLDTVRWSALTKHGGRDVG